MLKNYLKIALRNLLKFKIYSSINIFGLAFGLAGTVLVFLFVRDELTFDRFHEKANRIFRITSLQQLAGKESEQHIALSPPPLGPALVEAYPEISNAARMRRFPAIVKQAENVFEETVHFADASLFDIFTFPLVQGDPGAALTGSHSLVLSMEMAEKYFHNQNAIGKTLEIKLGNSFESFVVMGILDRIPKNSSLQFDMLLSFENVPLPENMLTNYTVNALDTYVLLEQPGHIDALAAKAENFLASHWPEAEDTPPPVLKLQALTDIHLDPSLKFNNVRVNDPVYSFILSGVAVIILLLACINFTTLATARSTFRNTEVGMRKVMGAQRKQLIQQFWGEAIFASFLALAVSITLIELSLPTFNSLTNKSLTIHYLSDPFIPAFLFGLTILAGLIAGSYPALLLSGFRPATMLQKKLKISDKNYVSRALVVFQFTLSICLIIGAIIVTRQVDYLQTKNLGFDKDAVVVLPVQDQNGQRLVELLKSEAASSERLVNVAATSFSFARGGAWGTKEVEWQGTEIEAFDFKIDYAFLQTVGIEMAAGRNFSLDFATDSQDAIIVNQTLANAFGWEDPVNKRFFFRGGEKTVIGVAKDFHFKSLHEKITPMIMHIQPGWPILRVLVRIRPDDIPASLNILREKWRTIYPETPFKYSFLDEDLDKQYQAEQRMGFIIRYAAILAVAISCLGLLGLASLIMVGRTKEIGIRKVLGASAAQITSLLAGSFLKLVLLANFIAWPVAWFAMNKWLQNFAYRIDIGWWAFVLAGCLVLAIVLVTVGIQTIRAALANPVESLRCE